MTEEARRASFWTPGRVLAAILVGLVLVLAAVNFDSVAVNLLVLKLTLPLFFLVVGALAIGYVVGWLSRRPKA